MIASLDLCLLLQRNPSTGPSVVVKTHASGASMGVGTCANTSILRGNEHHHVGSGNSGAGMQNIGWGGPRGPISHDGLTELSLLCRFCGVGLIQ